MLSIRVLPQRRASLRAALATLEIMTVLVAAHTWAGGSLPSAGWIGATGGLVFAAGTVALRRRVPLWALVPALTLTQLFLHSWLVVLAPAPQAGHAGHAHGGYLELTWQMVLVHVGGALATALIWELRRHAAEVVLTWAEAGLLPAPALRHTVAHVAPQLPLRRPLVVVPLRGPPVALLAA